MRPEERPIGYWLRELDRRLEQAFAAALSAHGVERRDWQVLNGLGPQDPFWVAGERPYAAVAGDLAARGWLEPDGTLTAAGSSAREEIAAEVAGIRRRAVSGLSDDDYVSTVRTLATMTENLNPPVPDDSGR
ncbi:hypothetical protein ABT297_22855 [Dactylosporangium sp. NPDC000555]|uniref:hypothetical protein n=1 Tax=Dactylosporangium sp. NPDC000555 TaxID=3154260 RepID=UPI00332BA457